MSKQFDAEGMSKLFNIGNDLTEFEDVDMIVDEETDIDVINNDEELDLVGETSAEKEIMNEMLLMLKEIKEIIGVAKFLLDTSPDNETIASAAKLFTSASQLMKELNKGVLDAKKQRFTERLEKIKIKARRELVERKAELESNRLPDLGDGATLNITQNNNNMVNFSQEDVIRKMLSIKKES